MPELTSEQIWRAKTDMEVFMAARQLEDYTDEGKAIIQAEVERRSTPEYQREIEAAERHRAEQERTASQSLHARFRRQAALLVFLLAIPALGYVVGVGLQREFTSEIRAAALKQSPNLTTQQLGRLTVQQLCAADAIDGSSVCTVSFAMNVVRVAAMVSAAAGCGLILAIAIAGRIARRDRSALLRWFKPGLSLTAAVIIGLVIVHACILVTVIVAGESAVLHQIHIGLVIAIAAGGIYGVHAIATNVFSLAKKLQVAVFGRRVARAEAPAAWELVDSLAERLGALRPDHMVVGLEPNFYVTEADVATPAGTIGGRTLYWSLSLSRMLTVPEISAILGHELAHFRGEDTRFSEHFYPIYRGAAVSLSSLSEIGSGRIRAAALLPAIAVFQFFLETFAVAERGLARIREFAADAAGASVTDQRVMASALVKVHAYSGCWAEVQRQTVWALKGGRSLTNLADVFAQVTTDNQSPERMRDAEEMQLTHPTDSHPTLSARLNALGVSRDNAAGDAAKGPVSDDAHGLFPQAVAWEHELSAAFQVMAARVLEINLPAARPLPDAVHDGPQPPLSPVRRCNRCGIKVLPTAEQRCPRCGDLV